MLTTASMLRRARRPAALFAIAVALCAVPSSALAALMASVLAFGTHATPVNFMTQPLGLNDCGNAVHIQFTGITSMGTTAQVIDVWRAAAATTMCPTGALARTGTAQVCFPINVSAGNTVTNLTQFNLGVTPSELFGPVPGNLAAVDPCTTPVTTTQYFFFAQTGNAGDTSTMWPAGTYLVMPIAVDTQRPTAPVLNGPAAGDTSVALSWTTGETGTIGSERVYFDPAGCSGGGDGGTGSSSVLMAGAPPPTSALVHTVPSLGTSGSVPTSALTGWASGTYGQSGAIAITVLDSAGNESMLSNVICVQHVRVTGFWEQYCAEHGMTTAQCTSNYHGCSVGVPSRRLDLGALGLLGAALGLLVARGTRRRAR